MVNKLAFYSTLTYTFAVKAYSKIIKYKWQGLANLKNTWPKSEKIILYGFFLSSDLRASKCQKLYD